MIAMAIFGAMFAAPEIAFALDHFNAPNSQYYFIRTSANSAIVPSGSQPKFLTGAGYVQLGTHYLLNDIKSQTWSNLLSTSDPFYKSPSIHGIVPFATGAVISSSDCPNNNCTSSVTMGRNDCFGTEVTSSSEVGFNASSEGNVSLISGFSLSVGSSTTNSAQYCSTVERQITCNYANLGYSNNQTAAIGLRYRYAKRTVGGKRVYFSPIVVELASRARYQLTTDQQNILNSSYKVCQLLGMDANAFPAIGNWQAYVKNNKYCPLKNESPVQYVSSSPVASDLAAGCYVTDDNVFPRQNFFMRYGVYQQR
jgi:hypothetical protein